MPLTLLPLPSDLCIFLEFQCLPDPGLYHLFILFDATHFLPAELIP